MARAADHGNIYLLPHGIGTDPGYIIQSHSWPGTYNYSICPESTLNTDHKGVAYVNEF